MTVLLCFICFRKSKGTQKHKNGAQYGLIGHHFYADDTQLYLLIHYYEANYIKYAEASSTQL